MSHNITNVNGQNEMAFVGELPWHGLGQKLTADASLETWAREAGMAWKVQRSKVRYETDRAGSAPRVWDDRHVLFRSDTKAPLGLVSDRYQIVQPLDVLKFFADVAERNHLRLETAGTLGGGAKYWAMAKLDQELKIAGVDRLKFYVLLATSCDGSMNTVGKLTSTRVVCANTLHVALGEAGDAVRVRHSSKFDADAVRVDLGLVKEAIDEFETTAAQLATKRLTKQAAVSVLVSAIGDAEAFRVALDKKGAAKAFEEQPNARVMAEILELYDGRALGSDLITSAGTAWGLVNAATQYFDHAAGRAQDSRLQSAWFGGNANRKQAIVAEALAL